MIIKPVEGRYCHAHWKSIQEASVGSKRNPIEHIHGKQKQPIWVIGKNETSTRDTSGGIIPGQSRNMEGSKMRFSKDAILEIG
jgi:hypothetical protein